MKTKSKLRVMHQVDVPEPPEVLIRALDDDFFSKIQMEKIPVLLRDLGEKWAGLCVHKDATQEGEIYLASDLVDEFQRRSENQRIRSIRGVYLHECAHRLTNKIHYGSFLAVEMLLYLRAGEDFIHRAKVYDLHEDPLSPPQVFEWAWTIAHELAPQAITAEDATKIILNRYDEWLEWLDGEDERQAQAEEERLQVLRQKKVSANRIRRLEQNQHLIAAFFFFLGFLARFIN